MNTSSVSTRVGDGGDLLCAGWSEESLFNKMFDFNKRPDAMIVSSRVRRFNRSVFQSSARTLVPPFKLVPLAIKRPPTDLKLI